MAPMLLCIAFFVTNVLFVVSYNNGVGETPLRGWSSWYPYAYNITEDLIKNNTLELIARGLSAAGYTYINIDEGWILNRSANGTLISDPSKFPSGMQSLGEFIHSKQLRYGLYSSRGTYQCGHKDYDAPGSYGHYQADAEFMAAMGADYVKLDSCGAVGNMTDAFAQYQQFGAFLNESGRHIYYDLCGWYWYYATVGPSISNSWRIFKDDWDWENVGSTLDVAYSGMQKYGRPYAWTNMDFLFSSNANNPGNRGNQTETQARAQFSLYALASSNLIISNAVSALSDFDIATYTNAELLAANGDAGPKGGPSAGFKIYGLSASDGVSVFGKMLGDGSVVCRLYRRQPKL